MNGYQNTPAARSAVLATLQALSVKGLNKGAAGNVSVRTDAGMLITPTGVAPADAEINSIVHMALGGEVDEGQLLPSSEWRLHADVYQAKLDVQAVVHCHSPYATILACARQAIPPMHYMVAAVSEKGIPLAAYARFGSEALARANRKALENAAACLLENHGQLATGKDLSSALALAELVESMAHCYWGTLAIGGPTLLNDTQMTDVSRAFTRYGQQNNTKI
ncbi:MAG: class II aldolase/adducin family protein [Pseudomonadota bacterium]